MSLADADPGSSLAAVTALLDLRPAPTHPTPGRARFGIVAGRRGPRFLVPLDHPDATAESCLAYLGLRDLRTRASRGAVGLALRFGGERAVIREVVDADAGPGSLLATVADLLEDPDEEPGLAVAVGLGHRDEVWKPTLQAFRPDGEPAAFVKVGLGPVAADLVRREAATLAAWARHPDPRLVVPDLLADTTWDGHPLAVVAPLPHDARRLPPGRPSAWPVRELDGPEIVAPLASMPWWTDRQEVEDEPRAVALLARVGERHGDASPTWGRWHGDWVPWNLARCHRGLIAWDWEYSEPGAPVGLDEVHGAYQQARVVEGRSVHDALACARAEAVRLATVGTSPTSVDGLRTQAGRDVRPDTVASAPWLADAHVAMLVTRATAQGRLLGRPAAYEAELFAAADAAVDASADLAPRLRGR